MTDESLEHMANEPEEKSDKIIETFVDSPDRKPKTLSEIAKSYGSEAYRFAKDVETHYEAEHIVLSPSPGKEHPRYKLNSDAVRRI